METATCDLNDPSTILPSAGSSFTCEFTYLFFFCITVLTRAVGIRVRPVLRRVCMTNKKTMEHVSWRFDHVIDCPIKYREDLKNF